MSNIQQTVAEIAVRKPSRGDQVMFGIGALALVVSVVWFAVFSQGRPWEMAIAAGASLVFMLVGRLHLFDSIKAGSLEFHLRKVALEAEVARDRAYATAEQLQDAVIAISRVSLDATARTGFWGSLPLTYRLDRKAEVERTLRSLGVKPDVVADVVAQITFIAKHLHAQKVKKAAETAVAQSEDVSRYPKIEELFKLLDDWNLQYVAPAARMRASLTDLGVTGGDVEEWLQDLECFEKTGQLRRPNRWQRGSGEDA